MRAFSHLIADLDRATPTSVKAAALEGYFRNTPPADAAWALWFLSGQRLKRAVKLTHLREWAAEAADMPLWLVEECHEHVGDLCETLALLLPANPNAAPLPLAQLTQQRLLPLASATEHVQRGLLRATWAELDTPQRFLWHKLITGTFRVGVSRTLLIRALANLADVDASVMAHRFTSDWQPSLEDFTRIVSLETASNEVARSYPFFLATPLEGELRALGEVQEWQAEWIWDGIRVQLLRRAGQTVLWSRGEEIITGAFPEIAEAAGAFPDGTVLDGQLLAWRVGSPLPFSQLQQRLNRRAASTVLRTRVPVVFIAYDLLEQGAADWRGRPLLERRQELERIVAESTEQPLPQNTPTRQPALVQSDLFATSAPTTPPPVVLRVSPILQTASWDDVEALHRQARASGAEGVMLKRRDSAYGVGRQQGAWWKWKVVPFTCAAVLVAAQPGHGQRASLFTDYTFAVWQGTKLVPVARANSGLTPEEIGAVDAFVQEHTTGRFGPVRSVKPELVFELAFAGIAPSTRHKSGLALRSPRIARWRQDMKPSEASTVETLHRLADPIGTA